jgi:uncharacterized protein YdhG (YjbR/CyaY superfamily)
MKAKKSSRSTAKRKTKSKSGSAEVDAYLAKAAPDQRAALQKLRATIRQACPRAVEVRAYGIAGFKYRGKPLMYIGYAKQHCGIYGSVPHKFLKDLKAFDVDKGTIRFQPKKPVPASLVKRMVRARMAAVDKK